jgi:predicted nucleic acid-binding protein
MTTEERWLFFDTSALVKYVHEEEGSERVVALIDDRSNAVCISALAQVEFASAMHRKFREEVLTEGQLQQALSGFDEVAQAFRIEPLESKVVERAEEFIRMYGRERALRSLDALHLATFSLVANQDAGWRFVVADNRLYGVAREEGCPVIHPVREK